jgi:hypothetical protein
MKPSISGLDPTVDTMSPVKQSLNTFILGDDYRTSDIHALCMLVPTR